MTASRSFFEVPLKPAIGSRFQPTGFPDIGAATFRRPVESGWQECLLVESPQSMANRLEGVGWDGASASPVEVLAGLPYVPVVADADDRFLTSSRLESHRLAAAFVKDSTLDGTSMVEVIKERLGLRDDTPLALAQIARAVFQLDPLCLVHGVFFADKKWPGQPKIARALTAFVEAEDVERADSGGVKRDHVRHALSDDAGGTAEGYGSVPFHRTEWTARSIIASFALDRDQLRSYGLGDAETDLLEAIALWEIRTLLDGGLRLRTACDLVPLDAEVVDQSGMELASAAELADRIRVGIAVASDRLGPVLEVRWTERGKKSKRTD